MSSVSVSLLRNYRRATLSRVFGSAKNTILDITDLIVSQKWQQGMIPRAIMWRYVPDGVSCQIKSPMRLLKCENSCTVGRSSYPLVMCMNMHQLQNCVASCPVVRKTKFDVRPSVSLSRGKARGAVGAFLVILQLYYRYGQSCKADTT